MNHLVSALWLTQQFGNRGDFGKRRVFHPPTAFKTGMLVKIRESLDVIHN
jgi:hypothetical protein